MKAILTLLIGLFLGLFNLSAQQQIEEMKVYMSPPCYFTYPEGYGGMKKYFNSFFSHSKYQKERLAEAKVVISFIVNKKGIVESPQIIQSTNSKLDSVVIESINKMMSWIPDSNCKNESLLVIIPLYFGAELAMTVDTIPTSVTDGIYLSKPVIIKYAANK